MGSLKLVKPFMHKYKYYLALYTLCVLLTYPLESIVIPKIFSGFFQSMKDININSSNEIFIGFYTKIMTFMLVITIAQAITSKLDTFLIPEFNESVSTNFFQNILKHYENNYTDLELGKILTRINGLPSVLREVTTDFFNWVIPKILTVLIINYYFYINNKTLGLISIGILFIIIYINLTSFKPCIDMSNERYTQFEEKSEAIQDKLSNLYSIYSAGNVDNEIKEYNNIAKEFEEIHRESMKCNHSIKNKNGFITSSILLILSGYMIYLFKNGEMKTEQLVTLFMVLIFYIPCLNTIITYLPDYNTQLGMITSVDSFIDDICKENEVKPNLVVSQGNIDIKNLNFGYSKDKNIFENFNLNIKPNSKVALIGPSGNGKSTLVKLIMGYYPVPPNTIFIDGQDINKFNLTSLRKQITYINQNTKLFHKTIFENIKYGNEVTNDQIMEVYNKFNLDRIYKNLSKGFDSDVGVNGDSLSGGQKQIILLLRNYFKNNKICILDEPTAALDEETRKIVLNIIKEISKNATLIIITHDENNLELVKDKIILNNGKIVSNQKHT
jgi:ATP-binding cassette, subfamily B, bacterial